MRIYIRALIIFILIFAIGIALRYYLQPFVTEFSLNIVFVSFLAVVFVLFIYLFGKGEWKIFTPIKWKPHYWSLLLLLIIMFGSNNYFQVLYSDNQYYPDAIKSLLGGYIFSYIISSTSEEIIYRGFIQSFINSNTVSNSSISKGNLFASTLFFITHLGFFTVMDTIFAITSLVNVIIFSLIAGYLFDKTKNILIPIIIHIGVNMLHVFIQITF